MKNTIKLTIALLTIIVVSCGNPVQEPLEYQEYIRKAKAENDSLNKVLNNVLDSMEKQKVN